MNHRQIKPGTGDMGDKMAQRNIIKLNNKFGVSLEIDAETGVYEVLYNGRNWLGKGLVSVLYNKAWYRNLISTNKACDDLCITNSKREDDLSDEIGVYTEICLTLQLKEAEYTFQAFFKFYYEKPCILFELEYPENPAYTVFPQFACGGSANMRNDLHSWVPGFMGQYGIRHHINAAEGFADPNRANMAIPLILYDDKYDTVILSPYGNYLVSCQYTEKIGGGYGYGFAGNKLVSCGLNQYFSIPSGFRHSTLLYFGNGINKATMEYGGMLLKRAGKQKPNKYKDDTISYLSYWVDYGSYYWSEIFENAKKIDYEDIMIKLAREAMEAGLYIKSWEVQDGDQNRWEEGLFEIKDDIMPHGLTYMREKLGQPLYSYFSPIEPGPYRLKYPYVFTGHVAYGDIGSIGMGDLFYTEDFWDDQVKKKEWGGVGLQHDFLSNYWNTPAAVDYIDKYMKSIAKACIKYRVSMQYCMCFSNHVLETAENKAVVSLQAICDHHVCEKDGGCGTNLRSFIFSSMLYGALGIWPARDNIQTMADPDAYQDLLAANLSGGPIQLGHEIGRANISLLRKTFREGDGLLLKPDRPLAPIDRCYIAEDSFIAYTETKNQVGIWKYVLALNIAYDGWNGGYFIPGECGCDVKEYILYDFENRTVKRIGRNERYKCVDGVKHSYYVLAPILENGFALIGDINKFVTLAEKRIANIIAEDGGLCFDVISGGNANVLIAGYSAKKPTKVSMSEIVYREADLKELSSISGNSWYWNSETGMWLVYIDFSVEKEIVVKTINISVGFTWTQM